MGTTTKAGAVVLPVLSDIEAARNRIAPYAVRTPLIEHPAINHRCGGRVFLKAENLQRIGAFKFRGAYNKISQLDPKAASGGVVACSSGNHAQGVAHAASLCGMASLIVMPRDAPAMKLARTKAFGAEVVLCDRESEDRNAIAQRLCDERDAVFVAPFDDFDVTAGQGTVGLELAEQMEAAGAAPDAVLVPTGGGGLLCGVTVAVKARLLDAQIYAVEPEGFDDFTRSIASGRREKNQRSSGSICDAILTDSPGQMALAGAATYGITGLVVSDADAAEAMRFAYRELKLVLEPGGAVALAAVLAGKLPTAGRNLAVLLSGGNVDPGLYARIIQGD